MVLRKKKNILVTGSNGFIGFALTKALRMKYSNDQILSPSSKELNLMDIQSVERYLCENKVNVVYHVAAKHAGVGSGINNPLYFLETNLLMNYNIVVASRKSGVEKFITLGSSCTYHIGLDHPAAESDIWNQRAENTYGSCKQILLEHLLAQDSMKWVYLIPPNLYGPGDHFGEKGTHFIPATVQKFQNAIYCGENTISVWGDGSQTRDFLYLTDVVSVLLLALEDPRYDCQPINIATGRQVSIRQIAELIQEYMNAKNISISWDIDKPTGIHAREIDNHIFMRINPDYEFIQIEEGIHLTLDWYWKGANRENLGDYICS